MRSSVGSRRTAADPQTHNSNQYHVIYHVLCLAATSQHTGGPFLGLEPGLGLTAPFLDQHKRDKAAGAAAGDGSYAATPNSVAASESLQPFARGPAAPAAVAAADTAAGSAAAAAAAVTEAAEEKKAAGFRQLQQSGMFERGELPAMLPITGWLRCVRRVVVTARGPYTLCIAKHCKVRYLVSSCRTGELYALLQCCCCRCCCVVLYGIINAVVGIPTMISFAAIVYQVSLLVHCSALHTRALVVPHYRTLHQTYRQPPGFL